MKSEQQNMAKKLAIGVTNRLFHAFDIHGIKNNKDNSDETLNSNWNIGQKIIAKKVKGKKYYDEGSNSINVKPSPAQVPHHDCAQQT